MREYAFVEWPFFNGGKIPVILQELYTGEVLGLGSTDEATFRQLQHEMSVTPAQLGIDESGLSTGLSRGMIARRILVSRSRDLAVVLVEVHRFDETHGLSAFREDDGKRRTSHLSDALYGLWHLISW